MGGVWFGLVGKGDLAGERLPPPSLRLSPPLVPLDSPAERHVVTSSWWPPPPPLLVRLGVSVRREDKGCEGTLA